MSSPRIVVIGSVNMDLMLRCRKLPGVGETVRGDQFATAPGGKGANQAIAAARLGATVSFVGCVGADEFGAQARAALAAEGIDIRHLVNNADRAATGIAMVLSEDSGENCIALSAGANASLSPAHIDAAQELLGDAALVVCQLETPLPTVLHALAWARRHGLPVLLNPAPAQALPADQLAGIELLVPNRLEAASLCGFAVEGVTGGLAAARELRRRGAGTVIVTLGALGVAVADSGGAAHHAARLVSAIDSTGAGDTFVGALAAERVRGVALSDAIAFAQAAAACSVQGRGAQASMPRRADVLRCRQ